MAQKHTGYNAYAKKKNSQHLPALNKVKKKENQNEMAVSEHLNESNPATLFSKENADSATSQTTEVKKNSLATNQADSAADITVKTHIASDRLSLYLFVSPDAVFSHVSADNHSYQQQRNREATSRLSWSSGIRVRYNINAHWSGNIGIQLSVANQKITLPGKTSHNRYTSLDVPLIAGYRIYKNRWEIDANAGIILNISSAYKGYISSVSNEPLDIKEENVYKSNTSLSYYGGIQFLYRPANRIALFAEPYVKYQPRNIANSFQPFQEHAQRVGLLLGGRYRFGK